MQRRNQTGNESGLGENRRPARQRGELLERFETRRRRLRHGAELNCGARQHRRGAQRPFGMKREQAERAEPAVDCDFRGRADTLGLENLMSMNRGGELSGEDNRGAENGERARESPRQRNRPALRA